MRPTGADSRLDKASLEASLRRSQRRPGEPPADHLLRITPPPGRDDWEWWNDGDDSPEGMAVYYAARDAWTNVARDSIEELVAEAAAALPIGGGDLRLCRECYATTHPYLENCLGCGLLIGTAIWQSGTFLSREAVLRDRIRQRVETQRLHEEQGDPDPFGKPLVERIAADLWLRPDLDPRRHEIERAETAGRLKEMHSASQLAAQGSASLFSAMEFRYLGGLPSYPGMFDVRLEAGLDVLRVISGGASIAAIPYHLILGAWPFAERIDISRTRLGFFGQGFMYFPNPTYDGGGLSIAAIHGGQPVVFAVGNRDGWLTKKAPFEFYASLPIPLAEKIEDAVREREGSVGPERVAAELGIALAH